MVLHNNLSGDKIFDFFPLLPRGVATIFSLSFEKELLIFFPSPIRRGAG